MSDKFKSGQGRAVSDKISTQELADLMEQAADKFESGQLKWGKGKFYYSQENTYCAVGGVLQAHLGEVQLGQKYGDLSHSGVLWLADLAAEVLEGVLQEDPVIRSGVFTFYGWNDRPERTLPEVIDVLKHTAKELRNRS